jgi:hypothetical protein
MAPYPPLTLVDNMVLQPYSLAVDAQLVVRLGSGIGSVLPEA